MKDIVQVLIEWEELLRDTRATLYFDKDRFMVCMQDAYECFKDKLNKDSYSRDEMSLYGLLTSYSVINSAIDFEKAKGNEGLLEKYIALNASTNAATDLSIGIINPKRVIIEKNKMLSRIQYIDGSSKVLTYDFEMGDLSDYTDEVKAGAPTAFYRIDEE